MADGDMEFDVGEELDDLEPDMDPDDIVNEETEQAANLVPIFVETDAGKKALKKISDRILTDIDNATDSREEYVERIAKDWKLFAGDLPDKSFPFQDCANLHVPIAIENTMRITLHAYGELFGDWTNVFGVLPMGPEDDITAQILTVHGNWQIRQQIPGFKREQHRGLLSFFYIGDTTCHSLWDGYCNQHRMLAPDEFITPYSYTTTRPDYADLPWYARVYPLYKHELEREGKVGEWHDVEAVLERKSPSWDDDPEQRVHEAIAELNGIHIPEDDAHAPFKLYWYEGWMELPGQEESRWCKAIIDPRTRALLLLTILETHNWQDKQRYLMQSQERDTYFQAQEAHQSAEMERATQQQQLSLLAQTSMDPQAQFEASQALQAMANDPLPPPPVAPSWMQDPNDPQEEPEPPRREPVRLFAHGVCIEPLVGNLGIGYGRILADYNRAANTSLDQFVDAASLANAGCLITTDNISFEGGFSLGIGKQLKVRGASGRQLKDDIMPFSFPPANQQLLTLVDMARNSARESAQSPEVLSGEPGKSGETYRGLAARIEQATKMLSVQSRKYLDFFEQIMRNNAFLNSIYLRDEELFTVTNHALRSLPTSPESLNSRQAGMPAIPGQTGLIPIKVGKWMYERNYEVEFRCDLRFASQAQRIAESEEIVKMSMTVPILMQNQQFQYYAVKKDLEARGRQDLVAMLGPAPPPPIPQPPAVPGLPGAPGAVPGAGPAAAAPPGASPGPNRGPDGSAAPAPPNGGVPGRESHVAPFSPKPQEQ
jgi:hypothetical protein